MFPQLRIHDLHCIFESTFRHPRSLVHRNSSSFRLSSFILDYPSSFLLPYTIPIFNFIEVTLSCIILQRVHIICCIVYTIASRLASAFSAIPMVDTRRGESTAEGPGRGQGRERIRIFHTIAQAINKWWKKKNKECEYTVVPIQK